jgi:hypothetical protein
MSDQRLVSLVVCFMAAEVVAAALVVVAIATAGLVWAAASLAPAFVGLIIAVIVLCAARTGPGAAGGGRL